MRSFQPPTEGPSNAANRVGRRRRTDLTLPLPQRDNSLAVPLPLPPTSSQTIGYHELTRINRIGSGAGGTVYKVIHRPTGKFYALKVIHGNHDDAVRVQMCREIQILRNVNNPNVVKCHDLFDQIGGEIQVLLEYMDKGSLERYHIANESDLSFVARQVLSGLCYLHKQRIVHRDVKPSNLLINSSQNVKIADFGVSRILAQTMDCSSSVGTIAYMSPERINTDLNHGQYDGYAGDIWSFGVSILELYVGKYPFSVERQGDWASLMWAICMSQPPVAPETASMEFRDFISCCLQKEPAKRWSAERLLRHPFILQHASPLSNVSARNQLPGSNQVRPSHLLPQPPAPHFSSA